MDREQKWLYAIVPHLPHETTSPPPLAQLRREDPMAIVALYLPTPDPRAACVGRCSGLCWCHVGKRRALKDSIVTGPDLSPQPTAGDGTLSGYAPRVFLLPSLFVETGFVAGCAVLILGEYFP